MEGRRKQKLRKYFREQSSSWQILFGILFLNHFNLTRENFEFDIRDAIKLCNDEQDFENIYSIIEYLEYHEDEITETLQNLQFKPISWQYDFIENISALSGFKITQTLGKDALATAYGYALVVPEINFNQICQELDDKYLKLFSSASAKMQKLKRNFILALECALWEEDGIDKMNFRELLNIYIPRAGINEVIRAYKQALSPDVKLTKDEKECLAFAYYSPFFCDEVNIAHGAMPEGSIFFCTETKLQEDKDLFARNRNYFEDYDDNTDFEQEDDDEEYDEENAPNADDEDDDDICFDDSAPFNHLALYVDPLQRCVIDSMLCDDAYANVYIQKFPLEKLNNSLPDFIRYNKGCLYTVEFVKDVKDLDVVQKLNHHINSYQEAIEQLNNELKYSSGLSLAERFKIENKLSIKENLLNECFFVS